MASTLHHPACPAFHTTPRSPPCQTYTYGCHGTLYLNAAALTLWSVYEFYWATFNLTLKAAPSFSGRVKLYSNSTTGVNDGLHIFMENGHFQAQRIEFLNGHGGSLYFSSTTATLTDCVIAGTRFNDSAEGYSTNSTQHWGAVTVVDNSTLHCTGCIVFNNSARFPAAVTSGSRFGVGVRVSESSKAYFTSSTVANNSLYSSGVASAFDAWGNWVGRSEKLYGAGVGVEKDSTAVFTACNFRYNRIVLGVDDSSQTGAGAAVYVGGSSINATFLRCQVTTNYVISTGSYWQASLGGGGVFVRGLSTGTIEGCNFTRNSVRTAEEGVCHEAFSAGVYLQHTSSFSISASRFVGNKVSVTGGWSYYQPPVYGGGLTLRASYDISISSCTFQSNTINVWSESISFGYGAGISVVASHSISITSSKFTRNEATGIGSGVALGAGIALSSRSYGVDIISPTFSFNNNTNPSPWGDYKGRALFLNSDSNATLTDANWTSDSLAYASTPTEIFVGYGCQLLGCTFGNAAMIETVAVVGATCTSSTSAPTPAPTSMPTSSQTSSPSRVPTLEPSGLPTLSPSNRPSASPSQAPSQAPSRSPTTIPSQVRGVPIFEASLCLMHVRVGADCKWQGAHLERCDEPWNCVVAGAISCPFLFS